MSRTAVVVCALLALAALAPATAQTPPPYNTMYYPSVIDHFATNTPGSEGAATFQQKILVSDAYWTSNSTGPVLLYTGNEGDIESFYENTGAIFEWAQALQSRVIFIEHRYYGSSLPFGSSSFTNANLRFLTIQQALEDYAVIIQYFQNQYNMNTVPWVAVGGSYGGVLSAWFRLRYPNLIAGAIAASAPIKYVSDEVDLTYFAAATADYAAQSPQCVDTVRQGYSDLAAMWENSNYAGIQQALRLCEMPTNETMEHVVLWTRNSLLSLAQYDYPYPTNFEAPLGAFPVTQACAFLTDAQYTPVEALGMAVGLFYNGTGGSLQCYDPVAEFIECADQTGCGLGNDATAWDYQVCAQFVYLPGSVGGKNDFFPEYIFDSRMLTAYCQRTYDITPDFNALNTDFGAGTSSILTDASNIVFSNGGLDPFHAGGFVPSGPSTKVYPSGLEVQQVGSGLTLLLLPLGAHHLDLRFSNALDPEQVTQARQTELQAIQAWTQEWHAAREEQASDPELPVEEEQAEQPRAEPALASQVLSHPQWRHSSRASASAPVAFKLALHHGDTAGLLATFHATFDPRRESYLAYPEEAEWRRMVQPHEETLRAVEQWLAEEVCTAARPSCKAEWSSVRDFLTVSMQAAEMEEFLGAGAELHEYSHARDAGRKYVRAGVDSIHHRIPQHLHAAVAFTGGITRWPSEVKAHGRSVGSKKPAQLHAERDLLSAEEVQAATTNEQKQALHVKAKALLEQRINADVATMQSTGSPLGDVPGGNSGLLAVTALTTSDGSINLEQVLVYCSLSPLVLATIDFYSGTVYCGAGSYFSGMRVVLTAPDGSQSTTDLTQVGLTQLNQAAVMGSIEVGSNYVGYTLSFQPMFGQGAFAAAAVYPFYLSGTQLVHPNFLASYVNMADQSVTQATSRLGIGALTVRNGPGFYSPADLQSFWSENGLPGSPQSYWKDYSQPPIRNDQTKPDGETQLDIQFGMGLMGSSVASGTIYHIGGETDTPFDDIITGVLADPNLPVVMSFSYGGPEAANNQGGASIAFTNTRFAALALRGISVFVSSGDTGAYLYNGNMQDTCSAFNPSFPASSPYVTSVGASQLKSTAVSVCPTSVQSSMEFGAAITGGGGFSQTSSQTQPDYQRDFVAAWQAQSSCQKPTTNYYNISNRGYPDLVLFGHDYITVTGGTDGQVDGTSASSPSLAGLFTIINDLRTKAGKPNVGFINYVLYQAAAADNRTFTDITEGSNRCLEAGAGGCCPDGFHACAGWDPVTGLGTPNFLYLAPFFGVSVGSAPSASLLECGPIDRSGKDNKKSLIIGGAIIGGVALLFLVWCVCRKKRRQQQRQQGHMTHMAAPLVYGQPGTYAQPPPGAYGAPPQNYGQTPYQPLRG